MGCNGPQEYNVLFLIGRGNDKSRWVDIILNVTIEDLPCGSSKDDAMAMARKEAEDKLARHCQSTGKSFEFKEVYDAS